MRVGWCGVAQRESDEGRMGGKRIAVGIDGSRVSYRALSMARQLMDPKSDTVVCLHVASAAKGTKLTYPVDVLKVECEGRMGGAKMVWEPVTKLPGEVTTAALVRATQEQGDSRSQGCALLCIGAYGRKGEAMEMFGHVMDGSLRVSGLNTLIAKGQSRMFGGADDELAAKAEAAKGASTPVGVVFFTDLSAVSLKGLAQVMRVCKPHDAITVAWVDTKNVVGVFPPGHRDRTIETLRRGGFSNVSCIGIPTAHDEENNRMSVPDTIMHYIDEADVELAILTKSGESTLGTHEAATAVLGSCSEAVKIGARCAVLLVDGN